MFVVRSGEYFFRKPLNIDYEIVPLIIMIIVTFVDIQHCIHIQIILMSLHCKFFSCQTADFIFFKLNRHFFCYLKYIINIDAVIVAWTLGHHPLAGLQTKVLVCQDLQRRQPQLLQLRFDVSSYFGLRKLKWSCKESDVVLWKVYCASYHRRWQIHFTVSKVEGVQVLYTSK